ncbi:ABC transporter ATP-binding protein [Microbacteriaceae bacterium 4G12]
MTDATIPLLRARSITKAFPDPGGGAVEVLRGISLVVEPGEFLAIVGPSGSGKSTLLYALSGLEAVDAGSVEIVGQTLGALKPSALARLRRDHLGFVFQSYNLIPSLTARENVALPARLAKRVLDADAVDAALASVGMSDRSTFRPRALSGGQQQRVAIARVLAARPDIVFADEPTGALDESSGRAVLALLRAAATAERSVVMVTHDLEAAAAADRVLVLRNGAIHRELDRPTPQDVLDAVTEAGHAR